MFVILLKFSDNKKKAKEYMPAHNEWINQGMDEGIFLVVGSIKNGMGGAILATNTSLENIQIRVNNDPFVIEKVVTAEILEISPNRVDERFNFLLSE